MKLYKKITFYFTLFLGLILSFYSFGTIRRIINSYDRLAYEYQSSNHRCAYFRGNGLPTDAMIGTQTLAEWWSGANSYRTNPLSSIVEADCYPKIYIYCVPNGWGGDPSCDGITSSGQNFVGSCDVNTDDIHICIVNSGAGYDSGGSDWTYACSSAGAPCTSGYTTTIPNASWTQSWNHDGRFASDNLEALIPFGYNTVCVSSRNAATDSYNTDYCFDTYR